MAYEIVNPEEVTVFEESMAERLNETLFNEYDVPLDSFVIRATGNGEFDIELTDEVEEIQEKMPTKLTF